jgi:hypothetical protein
MKPGRFTFPRRSSAVKRPRIVTRFLRVLVGKERPITRCLKASFEGAHSLCDTTSGQLDGDSDAGNKGRWVALHYTAPLDLAEGKLMPRSCLAASNSDHYRRLEYAIADRDVSVSVRRLARAATSRHTTRTTNMTEITSVAALPHGGRTQVKASHAPPTASTALPFHLTDAASPRFRRLRMIHRGCAVATSLAPRPTKAIPIRDLSTSTSDMRMILDPATAYSSIS